MKKKLFMAALLLMLCIGCLFTVSVAAESTTPALSIDYTNLSYSDSVYIKYAVSAKNVVEDDVRLLVWREADTNGYAYGTQDETVLPAYTDTIEGEEYIIFDYKNIAAKEMGDNIYVRACVTVGEDRYESETVKYSVLRYAYDTIHDENADDMLQELMQDMLAYGATAQKLFDYKATTPVYNKTTDTMDWYDITVVNGTLADGFTSGLIYQNTEFTMTAAPAPDGQVFSHWENSTGERMSTEASYTANATVNETYTAAYKYSYSIGLEYTKNLKDNRIVSYTVSGIGTCKDVDIVIPSRHNGLPVIYIGERAFDNCADVTSITIPDSVTNIGSFAFYDCTSLTSITIPNSVTKISQDAFHFCTSLKSVYITDIESWLKISFENSYSTPFCNGADLYLSDKLVDDLIIPDSVTSIHFIAFSGCTSLTSITIPDSVTSMSNDAFNGCTSLTSITVEVGNPVYHSNGNCLIKTATKTMIAGCMNSIIPSDDSVIKIGSSAFSGCTNLTSITIPDNVTSIGDDAFYNCTSLTNITIPDSITSIGDDAFYNCTSLASITIGNSVTSIGDHVFSGCTSLASITIGNSVTSIGEYAFHNCTSLTSITIPNSVTRIGNYAFEYCTSLTSITIPDSVTKIGYHAFRGCTSLASITIGNSVISIGDYAFSGCTSLSSITIPNSVTSIGDYAFAWCSSLASITIPDSVTSIGYQAFYGCTSLASITIGNGVASIGERAFYGCTSLTTIYYTGTPEEWEQISIGSDNTKLTSTTRYYYSETQPTDTTYQYWYYDDAGIPTIWQEN